MDDLDHLLGRGQTLDNSLPLRLVANPRDKILDYFVVDIGLEQRHSDLAQSTLQHFTRNAALAPQTAKDAL